MTPSKPASPSSPPAGPPPEAAGSAPADAVPAPLDQIMIQLTQAQAERSKQAEMIAGLASGLMFLRQQSMQQGVQLDQQVSAVRADLQRFQTGGARHAMAAIFHKLFRDLLGHVNQLDQLVAGSEAVTGDVTASWAASFRTARAGMEAVLAEWGCEPLRVEVGQIFDPEFHEAVEDPDVEVPPDLPAGTIIAVVRRGWTLHGTIIQYPLVVAS